MKNKILTILGWFFGIGALIGGIQRLFSNPLEAVYYLSFGVIIFPPINSLITKTSYAKWIKIAVGLLFFGSLITQVYLEQRPSPEKEMDKIKRSNVSITKQIAKSYCDKNKRCPSSLDELFSSGATGPYESYRVEDYFYRSIDDGKDCVISTVLSTKENYSRLCIGDNLEYVKYLKDPNAK
jgi:hypothetical protein